jgi:hypothetical protein
MEGGTTTMTDTKGAVEFLVGFSVDYTSKKQAAQRSDGVWFTRSQYRDMRYGYRWTAWKRERAFTRTGWQAPTFYEAPSSVRLPK